jgi:hypothetical protein
MNTARKYSIKVINENGQLESNLLREMADRFESLEFIADDPISVPHQFSKKRISKYPDCLPQFWLGVSVL